MGRTAAAGSPGATSADPGAAVRRLYLRALGRPPQADELALALAFVERQSAANAADLGKWKGSPAGNGEPVLSTWEQLAGCAVDQ